jgi:hypothetical protein
LDPRFTHVQQTSADIFLPDWRSFLESSGLAQERVERIFKLDALASSNERWDCVGLARDGLGFLVGLELVSAPAKTGHN